MPLNIWVGAFGISYIVRELFDDVSFPPNFYVEDMAVTYAVFVKSKKFVFDSTPCYYYRHLEGSRSKNSEIVDVETPKYFYNKYYGVRAQYPKLRLICFLLIF